MDDLLRAALAASGENTPKHATNVETRNSSQSLRNDPAVNNKIARANYQTVNPDCIMKLIIQPRKWGVSGRRGSSLAKSAVRLAIDTQLMNSAEVESNTVNNFTSGGKTLKATFKCSSAEAVSFLDSFEKDLGGRMTPSFQDKQKIYAQRKSEVCSKLMIQRGSSGKPVLSDDDKAKAYYESMKDYAFNGYEVYVSVKPEGVRATRSRSFKTLTLDEALQLYPSVQFV